MFLKKIVNWILVFSFILSSTVIINILLNVIIHFLDELKFLSESTIDFSSFLFGISIIFSIFLAKKINFKYDTYIVEFKNPISNDKFYLNPDGEVIYNINLVNEFNSKEDAGKAIHIFIKNSYSEDEYELYRNLISIPKIITIW